MIIKSRKGFAYLVIIFAVQLLLMWTYSVAYLAPNQKVSFNSDFTVLKELDYSTQKKHSEEIFVEGLVEKNKNYDLDLIFRRAIVSNDVINCYKYENYVIYESSRSNGQCVDSNFFTRFDSSLQKPFSDNLEGDLEKAYLQFDSKVKPEIKFSNENGKYDLNIYYDRNINSNFGSSNFRTTIYHKQVDFTKTINSYKYFYTELNDLIFNLKTCKFEEREKCFNEKLSDSFKGSELKVTLKSYKVDLDKNLFVLEFSQKNSKDFDFRGLIILDNSFFLG